MGLIDNEYTKVCSFGNFEFGYYEKPDGGCVDEYKAVARFWDKGSCFLDEKILSYEDSPGEAVESLTHYIEQGIVFDNFYGKHSFPGGYNLKYQDGSYTPVPVEK